MKSLADVEYWERALRCHYCHMHDLLCGFPENFPPLESNQISFLVNDGSCCDMILPSNGRKKF